MNFIKEGKYRHKIIEHLFNKYGESEENQSNRDQYDSSNKQTIEDISQINYQNEQKYRFSKKITHQKALIQDQDNLDMENQHVQQNILFSSGKDFPLKRNKQSTKFKKQDKIKDRIIKQSLLNTINEQKLHQGKQNYVFHQKNPILQETKNLKFDLNPKNLVKDKQNDTKNVNNQFKTKRQKKYKFFNTQKVYQALQSQRKLKLQDFMGKRNQQQQQILSQQKQQEVEKFQRQNPIHNKPTHRSKGSEQMINFLQSAKQKLFLKNNQLQKQINQQYDEKYCQSKQNQQNDMSLQQNAAEFTFQIQIQISPDQTCVIQLSQHSDPHLTARKFIQKNKQQLYSKGIYQQNLQQLLSNRISKQIEKHKKLMIGKKQRQIQEKYKNIIQQLQVNQIILKDYNLQQHHNQFTAKNAQKYHIMNMKNIKKDEFSHIYIENIDRNDKNQQNKKVVHFQQIIQTQQQLIDSHFISKDQQKPDNLSLQGYINSPHELITYRQNSSLYDNKQQSQQRQNQQFIQNFQELQQITHIPISKSVQKIRNNRKAYHIQQEFNEELGAMKILSKSRQKRRNSINNINTNYHNIQQINALSRQNKLKNTHQQNQLIGEQQNVIAQPRITNRGPLNLSNSLQINHISSQIVNCLGKQNILNGLKKKQVQKRQKIIKQKIQRQIQQLKQCSFKPKINNLSVSIDKNKKKIKLTTMLHLTQKAKNQHDQQHFVIQNFPIQKSQNKFAQKCQQSQQFNKILQKISNSKDLPTQKRRYDDLYNNYKIIQAKKQLIRQKSLNQIPFHPQINNISRMIVQSKRNSLNNSSYNDLNQSQSRSRSTHKKRVNHDNCYQQEHMKTLQNKRKSYNVQRNLEGLQIGQYLYKQAMRMKKKRQTVTHIDNKQFKPLQSSEKIINQLKRKRLSQYFDELLNCKPDQQQTLHANDIDFTDQRFMYQPFKFLLPLLQQLKQLNVSLTKEQFIQSGYQLINYLSQDEKAQFLQKRTYKLNDANMPQRSTSVMNRKSRQIIEKKRYYQANDIYHRGLLYKKNLNEKVESSIENRVRNELRSCTFKPQINQQFYKFN